LFVPLTGYAGFDATFFAVLKTNMSEEEECVNDEEGAKEKKTTNNILYN